MGLHETKMLLHTKETVIRLKRQPAEWKKIFASYTSDKGLITRIYREVKKLNSKRINDPMKKQANELKGIFQRKKCKWPKDTQRNAQPLRPSRKYKKPH
jgi:phosphoketolase